MWQGIDPERLERCISSRWSPEIGDPTLMGWLTVAAYAVAGVACLLTARRSLEPRFWVILGLVMLALAVNKQLDLQSALTAMGRCISQMQGWYEERRAVQRRVIIGLIAAAVALMLLMLWAMRRNLGRVSLAIVGTAFVLGFVAVRAAGFHHVDTLINTTVGSARMNWVLELTGIVLILLNALWRLARDRAPPVAAR